MKNPWIYLFVLAALMELAGVQFENETLQLIAKPLLLPLLALYFRQEVKGTPSGLTSWVLTAFFFSWAGDVLLLFQEKKSVFFLAGLSAFLLTHLAYIVFFHRIRVRENVKPRPWLLVGVVLYYGGLIYLLSPYLGDMKIPVRVYGIVISFMFLLAMHLLYTGNKMAGKLMMGGALLFVLSDSLLAINKFYRPFEGAGLAVMLTYLLAQAGIAEGAARYIRSAKSH